MLLILHEIPVDHFWPLQHLLRIILEKIGASYPEGGSDASSENRNFSKSKTTL
jgi:hypothetical protein